MSAKTSIQNWKQSLLALSLLAFAGCSGTEAVPGIVRVTGEVTLNGDPVEGATVTFQPEGAARAASGRTDAKGAFKLTTLNPGDGALPGNYKVMISKVEDTDPAHQMSAEEFTAMVSGGKRPPSGATRPGKKAENVGLKYHVPQKYMDANKSGLTATVDASGKNHIVFPLE